MPVEGVHLKLHIEQRRDPKVDGSPVVDWIVVKESKNEEKTFKFSS